MHPLLYMEWIAFNARIHIELFYNWFFNWFVQSRKED